MKVWVTALCLASGTAVAQVPGRHPMPEPLLAESVTDIDSSEAGELELDVSAARTSPGRTWLAAAEVEWRALERLGLALEVGAGLDAAARSEDPMSVRLAAAFVLLHDF